MIITEEEALEACLELPFTYADMPFGPDWQAVRHRENSKVFALIFEREGNVWVNLKADPIAAELWRSIYPSVLPAYHMNKQHWISVILDGRMEDEDIKRLIAESYDLTAKKKRKK